MQSVFAPLKTNGCRDYVAVVGVRRCPPQSGSRMESEPGEIKLLSERESGGFCPLGLPAMQASERASIVSGAPYVGCASTMAAGPSISDTSVAELTERVRYGKRAARTAVHLSLSRVRNGLFALTHAAKRPVDLQLEAGSW